MTGFPYPKGSEWRKWDLHIHSPYSYGGDYKIFIANLKKSNADVIGINDYCSICGYEEILNVNSINKILFPIIEFRMNNIVLDKDDPRANKGPRINFHIIFSNKVKLSFIKTWLNSLECLYEGGKTEKLGNINDSSEERLKLNFNYFDVIKFLEKDENLKDNFLVWLPYDEYGGIDNINPEIDKYFKLGLINKTHVIGSSNKKQIDFFLWKSDKYSESKIEQWLNGRKLPCIKGSDSHEDAYPFGKLKDNNSKPIDKYCWIKADPTFEGLKQIIFEPENRVYIGEEPPSIKIDKSKIIKSISFSDSNRWFEDNKPFELNEGLVSIIGGKGTGKTALIDVIAYATQSYRRYGKKGGESKSFLEKAFKELKGTKIKLQWADGHPDEKEIEDKLEDFLEEGKVRYLPQDFIEKLCTEIGKENLEKQIENVIFQKISKEYKANYSDFSGYKNAQIKVINDKKKRVNDQIKELTSKIFEIEELISVKVKKNNEISEIEKEISKLDEEMKKISSSVTDSGEQQKIISDLNNVNNEKTNIEKEISGLNSKLLKIDDIKNKISVFIENAGAFVEEVKADLKLIQITQEIIDNISVKLEPDNIETSIDNKKQDIETHINTKKEKLVKYIEKIRDLDSNLKIEKSKHDKIKEINNLSNQQKEKLSSLKEELNNIEESEKNLQDLCTKRESLFINFFEILFEEKEKLKGIYSPFEQILKKSPEENERSFDFSVQFNFDVKEMAEKGYEFIDRSNTGRFWQKTEQALLNEIEKLKFSPDLENKDLSIDDKKVIKNFLKDVENLFLKDEKEKEYKISTQLKKGKVKDFYDWLYLTNYFNVLYSIKFNDTDIDNLSPGLKGVALLILFLELDKEDSRPILIDQPEENLDNRSVYKTLKRYFREAKKNRQVIIVTHNPNLVVNTDSEQIIVADFDRGLTKQQSRISYVSGSLENSFPFNDNAEVVNLEKQGIREHACEILEGGKEAFEKRERKYGFKIS